MMVEDEVKVIRSIDGLGFVVLKIDVKMKMAIFVFFPSNNAILNVLLFKDTRFDFFEVNKSILRDLRESKKELFSLHIEGCFR